jgi:hypothetical protein
MLACDEAKAPNNALLEAAQFTKNGDLPLKRYTEMSKRDFVHRQRFVV